MNQQSIHDRIMSRADGGQQAVDAQSPDRSEPRRHWVRPPLLSVLGGVVVVGLGLAALQYAGALTAFQQTAGAKATGPDPSLPNTPFLAHAKQAGLRACSNVFPVLGQLLTNGAQYNVQSAWRNAEPDNHAVQALVGLDYATQDYSGPAAGIVFAAPTEAGCEGTMVRVTPFSKACGDVSASLARGSTLQNTLGQVAVYDLANNGGQALLVPSGNSCVVVSVAATMG